VKQRYSGSLWLPTCLCACVCVCVWCVCVCVCVCVYCVCVYYCVCVCVCIVCVSVRVCVCVCVLPRVCIPCTLTDVGTVSPRADEAARCSSASAAATHCDKADESHKSQDNHVEVFAKPSTRCGCPSQAHVAVNSLCVCASRGNHPRLTLLPRSLQ
jgi:hypothetical protein